MCVHTKYNTADNTVYLEMFVITNFRVKIFSCVEGTHENLFARKKFYMEIILHLVS